MSEQYAQASTSTSNRARPRDHANSKVVYRPVVDNPFRVDWPSVPVNVQNSVLARVVTMFEGVYEYHTERERSRKSRKRNRHSLGGDTSRSAKRRKVADEAAPSVPAEEAETTEPAESTEPIASTSEAPEAHSPPEDVVEPPVLQHITVGINQVTKLLEQTSQAFRRTLVPAQDPPEEPYPAKYPRLVLVCRADVNPPKLLAHLPYLVSACNSSRRADGLPGHIRDDVCLVPLSKGAEFSLAQAMGIRRVSVVAISSSAPQLEPLADLLEKVPILRSSRLVPPAASASAPPIPRAHIPTHIKLLKTTAPKDMKAAKEARTKGRAAAKERKKLKAKVVVPKKVTVVAVRDSRAGLL